MTDRCVGEMSTWAFLDGVRASALASMTVPVSVYVGGDGVGAVGGSSPHAAHSETMVAMRVIRMASASVMHLVHCMQASLRPRMRDLVAKGVTGRGERRGEGSGVRRRA